MTDPRRTYEAMRRLIDLLFDGPLASYSGYKSMAMHALDDHWDAAAAHGFLQRLHNLTYWYFHGSKES